MEESAPLGGLQVPSGVSVPPRCHRGPPPVLKPPWRTVGVLWSPQGPQGPHSVWVSMGVISGSLCGSGVPVWVWVSLWGSQDLHVGLGSLWGSGVPMGV